MAMLNDAPFIKVEATKFTEVGYHGRDVDKIITDLMDISMQLTKKRETEKVREKAKELVEDRILMKLMGPARSTTASKTKGGDNDAEEEKKNEPKGQSAKGRDSFRAMLAEGFLDEQEIEVDVPQPSNRGNDFSFGDTGNPNYVSMKISLDAEAGKTVTQRKKLPIPEARKVLLEAEIEQLLQAVDLKKEAIAAVEETGIVFIDEIDKICTSSATCGRHNCVHQTWECEN
jgi:ATP-dependent HslUV protease ATP-binding subunit HslU